MQRSPHHPTRKIYTSELEIPDDQIDAFVQWYAFRHAPDIYQIGFEVCTSYRAVAGNMAILDLYEIQSVDIFDTPRYRTIAQTDPYSAELLARRTDKAHGIYSQVFVAPEPVDTRALLNADWVSVERFDCEDETALTAYLDGGEAERILLAGAKRVRLVARTKAGPRHVSHRPRWILLVEWPQQPAIDDVGARLQAHFGSQVSATSHFTGYRLYPWPDRPETLPAGARRPFA